MTLFRPQNQQGTSEWYLIVTWIIKDTLMQSVDLVFTTLEIYLALGNIYRWITPKF